jgi:hypothetical protein
MTLPPFLAAIPLPILIAVPVVGVAVVAWYELIYKKTPAAGSLAAPSLAAAAVAAAAPAPPKPPKPPGPSLNPILVNAAKTWPVGSPQYNRLMAAAGFGASMGLVHAPTPKTPHKLMPISSGGGGGSSATALSQTILSTAQQLLSMLPSPFPGDASYGINEQVVRAALGQLIATPTVAQLNTTVSALRMNTSTQAQSTAATLAGLSPNLQAV